MIIITIKKFLNFINQLYRPKGWKWTSKIIYKHSICRKSLDTVLSFIITVMSFNKFINLESLHLL